MSCEICKILKDFKKALNPDQYRHGDIKEIGEAIDKTIDKHNARVHK